MNEYAGKLVREDFLDFIKKTYPEFFEDNEDYTQLLASINQAAAEEQSKFISEHCNEYEFPCMVFDVNAADI